MILVPSMEPDVSRRKPAMRLRVGYLPDLVTRSGGGAIISNFPNVFPFSVRRATRGRTLSGMNLWERTSAFTVDKLLENIVGSDSDSGRWDTVIEMD